MSKEHVVEIFVNGWSIQQLQRAMDRLWVRHNQACVRKIVCSHERRRELIHAMDLERRLIGYHSPNLDCEVTVQAERYFAPDRAALIPDDENATEWFNFKTGLLETADGVVVV